MPLRRSLLVVVVLWQWTGNGLGAEDPFAAHVRPTPPLSPEEELRSFRLPEGFRIQLFAAEPQINKPLNMAFDHRGRMWLTNTLEYPYAAPENRPGRDSVRILEDIDGDGRADRVTTFADGLNIPIGILPYGDGAIVFSIPYIWHLRDSDGDDRCDTRTRLYGPFGYDRDTHGLNNAFRRGFDGWVYACHGFNNHSEVSGGDGHTVRMHSGNTYRFRLDGSRIEQFTWGQVNPFGMAIDALGNLFTADCHSRPIYQLLRGGYYPSFGKPDDGLGFVPEMMRHAHGSTAIAGIALYDAENFPPEYRGNIFTGNVMTSRVNRDALEARGSTFTAVERPDFVVTTDPWFRPVDLQVGPDGALYVADFYNRIIGHYEVPLDHPGRDRHRGRIWRITYDGGSAPRDPPMADLSRAGISELIGLLDSTNATQRLQALNALVDRADDHAAAAVREAFRNSSSERLRSHAVWALARLGALDDDVLAVAAGAERAVRVHAMKALAEFPRLTERQHAIVLARLGDADAFVRRAAADALGRHPRLENVPALLAALDGAAADDPMLRHGLRIALKRQFELPEYMGRQDPAELPEAASRAIADVAVAIPSPEAGAFLIQHVRRFAEPDNLAARYLQHAARFAPDAQTEALAEFVRQKYAASTDFQTALFLPVLDGLDRRGTPPGPAVGSWGTELIRAMFASAQNGAADWHHRRVPDVPASGNPWGLTELRCADGTSAWLLDSKALGEQLTGLLRSPSFDLPPKLSFYVAGHNGPTNAPAVLRNFVRLRDAASDELLREAVPPRNDIAQPVVWDLGELAGRRGYLELVDADAAPGFAWLAVGRFEPAVVAVPKLAPHLVTGRLQTATDLVRRLKRTEFLPELNALLTSGRSDAPVLLAAAHTHAALRPDPRAGALAAVLDDPDLAESTRTQTGRAIAQRDEPLLDEALQAVMRSVPARLQGVLAEALAGEAAGAHTLLDLIAAGHASPRLLQAAGVTARLQALRSEEISARRTQLLAGWPSPDEELQRLIESRRKGYAAALASADRGKLVYQKNCAACHRIGEEGRLIGPQLDGIGQRGLERLLEDLLDPNRNVDVAFRITTLVLKSGQTRSGLLRRDDGAVLVLADNRGEEFTVAKSEIDEQIRSNVSLMPEGVPRSISEQELNDLLAYLLAQRQQR